MADASLLFATLVPKAEQSTPWYPPVLILVVAVSVWFVTRRWEFIGLTAVPLLGFFVLRYVTVTALRYGISALVLAVLAASVISAVRKGLFVRPENARGQVKLWRFLIRPAAMAFPVLLFVWGRTWTLLLLAVVTAGFLALDLTRLSATRVNRFLFRRAPSTFKAKEKDRLSSMTLFLLAALLVTLIFDRTVTLYALAFMVFGDFSAKFFGIWFGRTPLFNKTVEGTLSHFLACLAVGSILAEFIFVPLPALLLSVFLAACAEALPLDLDDNLSVGIISASALHFSLRLFS